MTVISLPKKVFSRDVNETFSFETETFES